MVFVTITMTVHSFTVCRLSRGHLGSRRGPTAEPSPHLYFHPTTKDTRWEGGCADSREPLPSTQRGQQSFHNPQRLRCLVLNPAFYFTRTARRAHTAFVAAPDPVHDPTGLTGLHCTSRHQAHGPPHHTRFRRYRGARTSPKASITLWRRQLVIQLAVHSPSLVGDHGVCLHGLRDTLTGPYDPCLRHTHKSLHRHNMSPLRNRLTHNHCAQR